MNWVERLFGQSVALDSAPLIYFMERHPDFYQVVLPFFEALERGEFKVLTSTITITEVLTHPLRHGWARLVDVYREFFANYLPVISVTPEIAETAAQLRADHGLCTPDVIEVATAINRGSTTFFTNDVRLTRIKQLEILTLSDLND